VYIIGGKEGSRRRPGLTALLLAPRRRIGEMRPVDLGGHGVSRRVQVGRAGNRRRRGLRGPVYLAMDD